jgi:alkaline phosphatase D
MTLNRRRFLSLAAALGASAAWSEAAAAPSKLKWTERRDLFPEGVASGDPQADSVILWTRRPPVAGGAAPKITVEVAEDAGFQRVVAAAPAVVSADSDWTARVLVGGLKPRSVYWYRFTDAEGLGSRVGRTLTAPALDDPRTVRFTFVSCQNANQGAMNAYRRMIFEDEKAGEARLDFVLHLGDFIYEIVWYPEDRPKGMYDRRLRDIVRYEHGQKVADFHVPTTLDDYRAVYRAYLHDPDLQDARARWPFVNMWDNHEFSWRGYQSIQKFGRDTFWGQSKKVAANQAWFEFQPARVAHAGGSLERFAAPKVADVAITAFDDHGLGQEPNNLAAVESLTGYRALRFGRNVELILTDQHSYRSEEPSDRPEGAAFDAPDFPYLTPEEVTKILDAGRDYGGGKPPATIPFGGQQIANYRKDGPPVSMLGARQKAWFLDTLKGSKATWKIWGATNGTLDMRADPQNLPAGLGNKPWPGAAYGCGGGGDWSGAFGERAQVYDFVRDHKIAGFATVSGDRHSFWAGLSAKALPPKAFEPVGVAFITGSISAPGLAEGAAYNIKKDAPLRSLYLVDRPGGPEPTINLLLKHGVRSCLEYARSGDVAKARALSNPDLSPHVAFVDMGGHGYGLVRASAQAIETEFVCIPRPLERSATPDGGPLAYRVTHRAPLWKAGERPKLEQRVLEGDPKLSI